MKTMLLMSAAAGLASVLMSNREPAGDIDPDTIGKVRILITEKGDMNVFTGDKDDEGAPTFHEEGDDLYVKKSTYESLRDKGYATKYGVKSVAAAAKEAADAEVRAAQLAELEQLRADKAGREKAAAAAVAETAALSTELEQLRAEISARLKEDAEAEASANKALADAASAASAKKG